MFCIGGAIALAACAHGIAKATGLADWIGRRWIPLIDAILVAILALSSWLIFFKN